MGFLSLLMERLDDRMKKLVDDKRLIFKCCSLYYLDGLGQKEVADALGISRPTVSRLLQLGKDTGIVKIEVLNPDNTNYGQMERELEKKFSLQEGYIDQSLMQEFLGKGAVGDIALRYFDANGGAEAFSDFNERVAGISLRRLAQVPRRIGVACGKPKIAPVLGAIRGRYINILITDAECAAGLLASE